MALWAYAFQTVAALKTELGITGPLLDPVIETCINEASQMTEDAWGRHVVSRGSLTEYHPRDPSQVIFSAPPLVYGYDPLVPSSPLRPTLYLTEWPIVSVTSVNEDSARAYAGATLLAADTDYIVTKPTGKLTRVSGSLPRSWMWSYRAVKVVYVAGYQDTQSSVSGATAIPFALMRVFHELVRWMLDQRKPGGAVGVQSVSDATGSRTFSGPAYVTSGMQMALDAAGALRPSIAIRTGERDA